MTRGDPFLTLTKRQSASFFLHSLPAPKRNPHSVFLKRSSTAGLECGVNDPANRIGRHPVPTIPRTVIEETLDRGYECDKHLIPGHVVNTPCAVTNETFNRGYGSDKHLILGRVENKMWHRV